MRVNRCIGIRPSPLVLSGALVLVLAVSPVLAQSLLKSRRDFIVGDHPVLVSHVAHAVPLVLDRR